MSAIEKLNQEFEGVRSEAIKNQEVVEPTDEEKKNGWTTKTLTAYFADRLAGQSIAIDINSLSRRMDRRPATQKGYNPLRWRE